VVTQFDLNACSLVAWQKADAALNEAWDAALAALDEPVEARLRAAQRAWIAFRDAECEAQAAFFEGGSAQPMVRNGCLESLTLARTGEIRGYEER
jgi:uncharacterized protein YecT (DUF1311 family)